MRRNLLQHQLRNCPQFRFGICISHQQWHQRSVRGLRAAASIPSSKSDRLNTQEPENRSQTPKPIVSGLDEPSSHGSSAIPPGRLEAKDGQEKARSVPASSLAVFWDTPVPSEQDLLYAHDFFLTNRPSLLFTHARLLNLPFTEVPEVAFLGRSNVGKSSILNALTGSDICRTSYRPGFTKTMNAFSVGASVKERRARFNLIDMPGYGYRSDAEWGSEINKYLRKRKELRRVFVLIDATHGLKGLDRELLQNLGEGRIPHQIVFTKVDRLLFPKKIKPPLSEGRLRDRIAAVEKDLQQFTRMLQNQGPKRSGYQGRLPPFGQLIACAAEAGKWRYLGEGKAGALGMDALRWAILQATGLVPNKMTQSS